MSAVNTTEPDTTSSGGGAGGGGLKTSTKVGIFVGVLCLFILLVSFYFIAKWKRKPRILTAEDVFRQQSFERWSKNVAGGRDRTGSLPTETIESPVTRSSTTSQSTMVQPGDSRGKALH
ncbi:hypothetical protein BD410DRAFT_789486 [Rickenella mellea]|uniref:Uncharacterized protein n=1 Tax=Rickenella mellea TaxID=50990 RepID=A0A4Y7Q3D8_9AGAM|nr:hypothetical protein BD410DRAFT_789486 [Rickenella mellea]